MSKTQHFTVIEALASSILAYEKNNNRVERDSRWIHEGDKLVEVLPNKVIMLEILIKTPELVTDDIKARAELMSREVQHMVLMSTLSNGSTNPFVGKINEIILKEKVDYTSFGVLAWVPSVVAAYQKHEQVKHESALYERRSCFVGKLGEKIELDFVKIHSRYVRDRECYHVYGRDTQGNLVCYYASNENKVIDIGKIVGRVKAQTRDNFRGGACVTRLNYVKVINE